MFSIADKSWLDDCSEMWFKATMCENNFLDNRPWQHCSNLLHEAVKKMRDFNKDLDEGPFILLYPDGSEVINTPGTQSPFVLKEYKAELGKPYQRINIFICSKKDFEEG